MHSVLSMDGLLAKALLDNGEGSGEAGLLFSEILQDLTAMGCKAELGSTQMDFDPLRYLNNFSTHQGLTNIKSIP